MMNLDSVVNEDDQNFKKKMTGTTSINQMVDKGKLVWLLCTLLGMGILLPWNSFISPFFYWSLVYPRFPFMFWVGLVYNYPNILGMAIMMKIGEKMNTKISIILFFSLNVIMLGLVPSLRYFEFITNDWRTELTLTFSAIAVCGICTAVLFSKVLAFTAVLPPNYTGAVMSGNGVGGLLTITIFFISYFAFDTTTLAGAQTSALIFFGFSGLICVLCIIGIIILNRLPYFKYHLDKQNEEIPSFLHEDDVLEARSCGTIITIILPQAVCAFLTFTITLGLFPGVSSLFPVQENSIFEPSLFPSISVALFQLGDVIGRTIPGMVFIDLRKYIFIPTLLRILFIPIFLLLVGGPNYVPFGALFQKDWIIMLVMFVFSFTNGFFGTLPMMYGPSSNKLRNSERPIAGAAMGFFLQFGILVGQHVAILLSYILTGKAL